MLLFFDPPAQFDCVKNHFETTGNYMPCNAKRSPTKHFKGEVIRDRRWDYERKEYFPPDPPYFRCLLLPGHAGQHVAIDYINDKYVISATWCDCDQDEDGVVVNGSAAIIQVKPEKNLFFQEANHG